MLTLFLIGRRQVKHHQFHCKYPYCVIFILFVNIFGLDFSAKNERKNAVDKLESLTAYQLLEAIPGALAKANTKKTKKMTPKQPITSQLPKLDVKVCNYTITELNL